ncbi:2,3,4,5-tetrahydropyridine-2,6-dicarboxylate N-succinyltransferase [Frankia sp. AgB1.9]|uniref:2,3,4,5-tetrahydropyridine-2,6-dicarboxylate N-succinyltransferase n=1 Tax=unclassified Frankia TaxID=2632575 RepID=UPI0019318668|nr:MULTISPECIES: 2,3,4,5-tetrahydropyridine-2,6-dicarboxylate N-succinyltransferase [unclassified Frankia]MBL7492718.1 2,3,4,5-tetrahydropyridine-2,6-dicarboxylate N-succinyltransferase [Frankia sp. AgW1.1]MBL7549667.1 2,3,4,5-tetrahydropyridine-2,6-dicarboxylate N-succinyltransferase [Frankia sp. AgB1.9]MBL7623124.1 2,3,4,5-tetrahydropyridine-2,6-dicarboxylate N-succinyltransferase [Frankia sp. AgB1.8]
MSTSSFVSPLDSGIDELWARRADITPADADARKAVVAAVDAIDAGEARVAFVAADGSVVVDERAKHAILLSFKVLPMGESNAGDFHYHDRMPLKTRFDGVRVVPGAIVRWGAHIAPGAVLMPSYTNIGGFVDSGSMVDTWATVGSCAQVGKNVHLSGGVGLGGVLEPPNAVPVIVEDDAFVGSRSMIIDGARVHRGAKLGAGSILTASTHVFDANTGEEYPRGEIPERAVAVGASRVKSFPGGDFAMPCMLVLRTLAEGQIHDKLALNDVLREHGVAT